MAAPMFQPVGGMDEIAKGFQRAMGAGRITFNADIQSVHQDDAWNLANRHAFNGAITFQVQARQTIACLLTFNRLGGSGTAEMSGARISVDKIG